MEKYLYGVVENKLFVSALAGWMIAQVLKMILVLLLERELRWERLFGSGGMPSSHSAMTCGLATAAYMVHGVASAEFAITAIFAFIVMYDACHVRLETGKQATAIKALQDLVQKMGEKLPAEERLKELVGHTFPQVVVGGLIGIACGVGIYFLL